MVVRTQCDGRTVTGLYIGARNARRHFSKNTKSVELQLDDLEVHCELASSFWRDQPEIRDPRVCDWLTLRFFHGRSCHTPIPVAMIQAGDNVYRLQPFRILPAANGATQIGPGVAPDQQPDAKTDCEATVCRVRRFIRCSLNARLQYPPN